MKKILWLRIILSVALAIVTVGGIALIEHQLPYSAARNHITDALSLPAFLVVRMFYPEGVHSGSGAPSWGTAFLISNIIVYSLLWWLILEVFLRLRAGRSSKNSSTTASR